MSVLEKEHDYREEHFDFIQSHIRRFCLQCILSSKEIYWNLEARKLWFSIELCIKSIWEIALQNCLVFRYLLSSICCFRNVWRCIKLQFWNCAWDFELFFFFERFVFYFVRCSSFLGGVGFLWLCVRFFLLLLLVCFPSELTVFKSLGG